MPKLFTAPPDRGKQGPPIAIVPRFWVLVACALSWIVGGPAWAQGVALTPEASREHAAVARLVVESAVGSPARVTLFDQATMRLDGSLQFIHRDLASRYLRAYGQPEPDGLAGLFLQAGREEPWYATIRLVRDGFIDIATIKRWSADDILASIRDDLKPENAERAKRNQPPRVVAGWRIPPRFDMEKPSLLWSVLSYVPGVSAQSESDTIAHLAVFGREGFFEITIVTSGSVIRDNPGDIALLTQNLHFLEGKTYRDFDSATDTVARRGPETVFGVSNLRPLGFLENQLEEEHVMIFFVGGGMIAAAGVLALGMNITRRRRYRRRT